VYVAVDRRSLTKVAVKEYLPSRLADRMADGSIGVRSLRYQTLFREGMQGFARQARILAELDEPALIKPLRSWQQHGTAYMAMPLCNGRSLADSFHDSP
jgi:serine/threonine protein kinase